MRIQNLVRGLAGLVAVLMFSFPLHASNITGAGATFPYAVYTKWAEAYRAATGKRVNYQGIGSAGGIKQIRSRTVDFGGTDAPLSEAELRAAGLVQLPMAVGGITITMNLPGFTSGQIRLDGPTAAEIFRGAIRRWNDPALVALNPGVRLPDLPITVVHRSDGSGTTFAFSHYMAKQSSAFRRSVGTGTTVNWPTNGVGGRGNPGVAANVNKIRGAIGYVDIADALKGNMRLVALKNRAGNFILPTQATVEAATIGADFNVAGLAPDLLDQAHENAWPITTATYILLHARGDNADKRQGVLDFATWSLNNGQKMAEELGFVALPPNVVKLVEAEMRRIR